MGRGHLRLFPAVTQGPDHRAHLGESLPASRSMISSASVAPSGEPDRRRNSPAGLIAIAETWWATVSWSSLASSSRFGELGPFDQLFTGRGPVADC